MTVRNAISAQAEIQRLGNSLSTGVGDRLCGHDEQAGAWQTRTCHPNQRFACNACSRKPNMRVSASRVRAAS
jgi:hypothetical protein